MTPNSIPAPGSLVRVKDSYFTAKGLVGKFGIVVTSGHERFIPDSVSFRHGHIVVFVDGVEISFIISTLERTIELIQ